MSKTNLPDISQYVEYNSTTGHFFWKRSCSSQSRIVVGNRAGSVRQDGYRILTIEGHRILEHRAAWYICKGRWPSKQLDHINRIKDDNRIVNLRDVTATINQHNVGLRSDNTSGVKGVYYEKSSGKWKAQMNVNGVRKNLGRFLVIEDARKRVLQEQIRVLKEGNGP